LNPAKKLLFIDIETHPAIIASWSIRAPYAGAVWVERNTFILCFSAKWAHEKKVRVHSLPDYPRYKKDRYDDKPLCKELARYLDEADIVCAHNGDRFDLPLIMGRLFMNNIREPSPFDRIDTLKIARQFKLDSHKLDNISQQKSGERKIPNTGGHLWRTCGEGDDKSWAKMCRYCAHDTELLATRYEELAPWKRNHPALFNSGCPVCGSDNIHRRGRVRQTPKFQFNCRSCGHWWTAKP